MALRQPNDQATKSTRPSPGAPAGPVAGPEISVIVIAHLRPDFLEEALRSVAAQTLERSAYEVLLVKNFQDARIDELCLELGFQNVFTSAESGAAKYAVGIRQSRGRILTFLDYDDLYAPSRLSTVRQEFRSDPQLGFYRNGITFIDRSGDPIRAGDLRRSFRFLGRDGRRVVVAADRKKEVSPWLGLERPDLNISSMAIRREVVDLAEPYLDRIRLGLDALLFYAAWCSPFGVLVDPPRLTSYRLHGTNVTGRDWFLRTRLEDFAVIREMVEGLGLTEVAAELQSLAFYDELLRRLDDPGTSRVGLWQHARGFRRAARSIPSFAMRAQIAGMIAVGLASPTVARAAVHLYGGV